MSRSSSRLRPAPIGKNVHDGFRLVRRPIPSFPSSISRTRVAGCFEQLAVLDKLQPTLPCVEENDSSRVPKESCSRPRTDVAQSGRFGARFRGHLALGNAVVHKGQILAVKPCSRSLRTKPRVPRSSLLQPLGLVMPSGNGQLTFEHRIAVGGGAAMSEAEHCCSHRIGQHRADRLMPVKIIIDGPAFSGCGIQSLCAGITQ